MAGRLPDKLYLRRLARADARVDGVRPSGQLARLADGFAGAVADAVVQLDFGPSEIDLPRIAGKVATSAEFECQRCLEPVSIELEADIELVLISPDDEAGRSRAAAAGVDVMEVGEEAIDLAAFIQDELLLTAPDYPMHGEHGGMPCKIDGQFVGQPKADESPFAGLADLLEKTPESPTTGS